VAGRINCPWERRTRVNRCWAIICFAQSFFYLAATLPRRWRAVGSANRTACLRRRTCGQILVAIGLDIDEETYLDSKSVARPQNWTNVSCGSVPNSAVPDDVRRPMPMRLRQRPRIAFQIAGRFLRICGATGMKVGRALGTDLAQGTITLPVESVATTREHVIGVPEAPRRITLRPGRSACSGDAPAFVQAMPRRYTRGVAKPISEKVQSGDRATGTLAASGVY